MLGFIRLVEVISILIRLFQITDVRSYKFRLTCYEWLCHVILC